MGDEPFLFGQETYNYGFGGLETATEDFECQTDLSGSKTDLLGSLFNRNERQEYVNDAVAKRILLLKDILYELPELEASLLGPPPGSKHKHRKRISGEFGAFSARIFQGLFGSLFLVLVYACIFVMGLIVSSYLLSPIPLTGSTMRYYADKNIAEELQRIVIVPETPETGPLRIRGTFKVAYNVYNNTPFSGALSVFMNVSYMPQSGARADQERCFGDSTYKHVYKYKYSNVKGGELDFFRNTNFHHHDPAQREDVCKKKRFGSLVTLEKVQHAGDITGDVLSVLDTTVFNAFRAETLVENKIQIIPKIKRGLNRVVLLVTLDNEPHFSNDAATNESLAKRIVQDCERNGFLTLKFDASLQTFDTMLFSGNMLPTSFLPVSVPCSVSSNSDLMAKIRQLAKNQRDLYNRQQYILKKLNTALNM